VGHADIRGFTNITGTVGAVDPDSVVAITCLDTAIIEFFQAAPDGSFAATIFAPAGTAIQIKHVHFHDPFEQIDDTFSEVGPGGVIVEWMNATPGTIVYVPLNHTAGGGSIPFAMAGRFDPEAGEGYWTLEGVLGPQSPTGGGFLLPISATLRITTPAIIPGIELTGVTVMAKTSLVRLFDENGHQVTTNQVLVSNQLTPTGLPISRESGGWSPVETVDSVASLGQAPDNSLRATVHVTLTVPDSIPAGLYSPRMIIEETGVPMGAPNLHAMRGGGGLIFQNGHLPVIEVGTPAAARLLWALLTDTLDGGTRGTLDRDDRQQHGLIPLTAFQNDQFVIPRVDVRTGVPIQYRLEPFLPLIALTDRGIPNRPIIPFMLPSGSLTTTVQAPSGATTVLGPAPFLQSTNRSPAYADGKVRDNHGGAMHEVYQLTTMDERFDHTFEQYGHHVITMTGSVLDIWGNPYLGVAVFDFYVARPLLLDPGQLPTTPYEVGNAFSPQLQVYPPVPADIEIRLVHMPYSDPTQAVSHTYHVAGQANDFGYFQPTSSSAITLSAPGEFRVDVTASHLDGDGVLWMDNMTWGNVVETPNSPLVAHGRRGFDVSWITPTAWFFHEQLDYSAVAHTYYPYFSGDVFWGVEDHLIGDAIFPVVTIQDTVGEIYQIISQTWNTPHPLGWPWETLQDRFDAGEAPLVSTTSDGSEASWSPELINQFGYAYRTSQRPGARVHETISEDGFGIAYWRFNAPYGDQVGWEGDLRNDLKWQFGSAVFRVISPTNPINEYAIYGSLWTLIDEDDYFGPRVTPPFSGTHGSIGGGPIVTLQGQDVHLFFMPKGVQPGDVLETGDLATFSGHVGPPLNSWITATVTTPSGAPWRVIAGRANKVGWFYDPGEDFAVPEPGVWTVHVEVTHDVAIPAGGTPTGFNTGGVLGSADGRYHFYVVEPGSPRVPIFSPQPGFLTWPRDPDSQEIIGVTAVPIRALIPSELTDVVISYTIRMPGFILEEGTIIPSGGAFTILYDPPALHQDFPNLDLTARYASQPGLADPVLVSFLLTGFDGPQQVHQAGAVFFDGEEVHTFAINLDNAVYLPLVLRQHTSGP
jgi:hypothetical protein